MKTRTRIAISALAVLLVCASAAGAQSFALKAPIAAKPVLLTSVGQSADIEMVKVLLSRNKIEFTMDSLVKGSGLAVAKVKTLVLAIGGSSKGLGAAGISTESELERAKALISEAKKLGVKIIGIHVGGEARRGELSDKFINATVPFCDYVIVVAEGNQDKLFNKLCGTKIPLDSVNKIAEAGAPLAAAFLK